MPTVTEQLQRAVVQFAQQVHDEAVQDVIDELREAAPLGETGETRRQIRSVPLGAGTRPASRVEAPTPQAEWTEEGTEPHDIVPVNAQVLRFLGGGGRISQPGPSQRIATQAAGVIYTMIVHHPGNPPRAWFDPVVQTYEEKCQRAADRIVVVV